MSYLRISTPLSLVTRLNLFFSSIIVGTILISCGTGNGSVPELSLQGEWKQEGLGDTGINRINSSLEGLVLATKEGVFIGNGDGFTRVGLEEEDVMDVVLTGKNEMLAGIRSSDFSGGDTTLFKTTDGGVSWQPFMGNYGDENGNHTWVAALAVHPEDSQRLYARGGANVSRSRDGGQTWESVFLRWEHGGSNASLLKIDPNNPDILWAGGANAILQPYVVKSEDGGESWVLMDENLQIFVDVTFESTAHSVTIKPGRSSHVLLGLGIGIFRSTDGGESWESVLSGTSIYTLTHSIRKSEIVYASGRNATSMLFMLVSADFGDTWQTIEMEDGPTDIRVNDIVAVETGGREVLYLGTNKGVYSYTFEE